MGGKSISGDVTGVGTSKIRFDFVFDRVRYRRVIENFWRSRIARRAFLTALLDARCAGGQSGVEQEDVQQRDQRPEAGVQVRLSRLSGPTQSNVEPRECTAMASFAAFPGETRAPAADDDNLGATSVRHVPPASPRPICRKPLRSGALVAGSVAVTSNRLRFVGHAACGRRE
jgi:hypothetical protein